MTSSARLVENTPKLREGSKERVKILLVDDQPANLFSAEAVLESLGEEIVKAGSGREALVRLLDSDFAVILLDVMMPGMDGFETASLIRQRDRSKHTPIIFFTAVGKTEEFLFRGYDVGAVDYLFKPIVPEVLRAKVAVFVDLYRKSLLLHNHAQMLESKNAELERWIAMQHQAENEIKILNQHLEKRVFQLSELNDELEQFTSSVSHDLRGPLARIAGFARALDENKDLPSEERDLYRRRIRVSCERMVGLVDDLLRLARLGRSEVHREQVDLSGVAASIIAELRQRDPGREIEVGIEAGMEIEADPELMRIALNNLLENSWKFTRGKALAKIDVGSVPGSPAKTFFVRDNGAGFEMSNAERLFTPFQRLHDVNEFEGTGIGLATVHRIIKRQGGRIWAEAESGHGATFYFTCC